jgi:hypothetical protein
MTLQRRKREIGRESALQVASRPGLRTFGGPPMDNFRLMIIFLETNAKSIPNELSISKILSKFGEKLKKVHFNKLYIIFLFWLLSEFHFKFDSQVS